MLVFCQFHYIISSIFQFIVTTQAPNPLKGEFWSNSHHLCALIWLFFVKIIIFYSEIFLKTSNEVLLEVLRSHNFQYSPLIVNLKLSIVHYINIPSFSPCQWPEFLLSSIRERACLSDLLTLKVLSVLI